MNFIIGILGAGIGSGIMAIVLACLQRKWAKEDKCDSRITALVDAQKVTMIYEVKHIGKEYITRGEISVDDKETLREMYDAYKGLGGNGHLDTIMSEINRLKVIGE